MRGVAVLVLVQRGVDDDDVRGGRFAEANNNFININGAQAIAATEAETAAGGASEGPLSSVHGVSVQQRGHHHSGRAVHDGR